MLLVPPHNITTSIPTLIRSLSHSFIILLLRYVDRVSVSRLSLIHSLASHCNCHCRKPLFLFFVMTATPLISVSPDELRFHFELEKQTFCDLKVLNNTQSYVAFKVKTTSPKKYFVRPNTGVIQPWDSCIIRVTLQAQREYPPDMQCKDKFLLQSTTVSPNTDVDELPPDTFNKDSGNSIEDLKLRVSYISPTSPEGSSEDDAMKNSSQKLDNSSNQALQLLKEERDAAARQTRQMQQELDMMKRQRSRRGDPGFSFAFAIFVGLLGFLLGFLLKFLFSSPSTE